MTRLRWTAIACSILTAIGALGSASIAHAANDTARFNGKWKAAFLYNGVWVNIVSIHDASGYSNYVILPQGSAPVGNGKFSAADGKWTTDAPAPNDTGTYHFIDNNTADCKNAIGQQLVWQRENTPLPPVIGAAQGSALPAGTNFAQVKVVQAIEVCRKIAQTWQPDAVLVCANVFQPNPDGTVNILANPQAFTITFASPSKSIIMTYVSTMPAGNFVANPGARAPTVDYFPISPKAIDLTEAFASERLFGFKGQISQARLYYGHEGKKPERLVWSLEAGGAYPLIVSGATGAILSPFEVLDDKVADYNKLAAETAAAVARMRASMVHRRGAQGGGGAWLEAGMPFWSPDAHEGGANPANGGSNTDEEDTWDNDVGAQNAWEDGNTDAEARFDAGEPTVVVRRRGMIKTPPTFVSFLVAATVFISIQQTQADAPPKPTDPRAIEAVSQGDAAFAKHDLPAAIAQYTQAASIDPKFEAAFMHCGDALTAGHQLDKALDQYQKAIDLGTGDPQAYMRHARCAYQLGDVDKAILDCDWAIGWDIRDFDAYMFRGNCYFFQGDADTALADDSEAIALQPDNADAWYAQGLSANALNNDALVIFDMTQVIRLKPKFANAYLFRGGSNFNSGKYKEGLADGKQGLALDPNYFFAHYVVAENEMDLNDLDTAIADFSKALALNSQDAYSYNDRGLCYERKGNLDQAVADYRAAVNCDPNLTVAQNNLQSALSRVGNSGSTTIRR